jgi:hypothetical protein
VEFGGGRKIFVREVAEPVVCGDSASGTTWQEERIMWSGWLQGSEVVLTVNPD